MLKQKDSKLILNEIGFKSIDRFKDWDLSILIKMAEKLPTFKGWIEIRTYIDSKNLQLVKKIKPIKDTPVKRFRDSIRRAGLIGVEF